MGEDLSLASGLQEGEPPSLCNAVVETSDAGLRRSQETEFEGKAGKERS